MSIEKDIHFVVYRLGHLKNLEQENHLVRVLQDVGICLSQQVLVPVVSCCIRSPAAGHHLSCAQYGTVLHVHFTSHWLEAIELCSDVMSSDPEVNSSFIFPIGIF